MDLRGWCPFISASSRRSKGKPTSASDLMKNAKEEKTSVVSQDCNARLNSDRRFRVAQTPKDRGKKDVCNK
eukprot:2674636-Amphidinium_carterae.1